MSLQWELEYEVSRRPRQVVYIRIEADISALTYPNKRQAVCYPASTGGGAGRGDRGGRKSEKGGLKQTGSRGSVPTLQSHLSLSPRGEKHQLAYEAKHDMRLVANSKPLISIPLLILRVVATYHRQKVQHMLHGHIELQPVNVQELAFLIN